ncbi:uncharacterized protein LOC110460901 [Mizuhopecten yessoensis]|uniref:uncharacterized protein LOC110460901 n=1 Tax=Mizuhopecten yessoensis TaxID=6573 RepID=UPI000B45BAC0|nr:uncharacterized protein LOC110460901 [Mizuhopecten yessoensis]
MISGERGRLKENVVPSIFQWTQTPSPRRKREPKQPDDATQGTILEAYNGQLGSEVTVSTHHESAELVPEPEDLEPQAEGTQCTILGRCTIDNFRDNPKAINYYTGFTDFNHFMFFFNCLGPAATDLIHQFTSLSPHDQFFLTMMKLRQAKEDFELSMMFEISESSVSKIIVTWINFMYFQLKELSIWPSRSTVSDHMPQDFGKKFKNTRVILDATEVPIHKPSNVNAQSCTWSSYKHKNTVKTMIGCTPRGAVSYVSPAYGGSTSDRQIMENSELLDPKRDMFDKGDSIMADRGIMVQDLFATQDVFVNTPSMLRGKSQLEPQDVVKDRRIASKRIHIERVIGLGKRYKILSTPLPASKLKLGSRIIYICFSLLNFRPCIVDRFA